MTKARRGKRVTFSKSSGQAGEAKDTLTGLRFTITAQAGGDALIDFRTLRPRRMALAFARALRQLGGPGGTLSVRSTIKAYALAVSKYFSFLAQTGDKIAGPEDIKPRHVDGFEDWMEAAGLSRTHLFTLLIKIVATLRQIASDVEENISDELKDRLRYVSAKPFERSPPRDAYSPYIARQLRDAARADVEQLFRRIDINEVIEGDESLRYAVEAVSDVIRSEGRIGHAHLAFKSLYFARARRGLPVSTLIEDVHGGHHLLAKDLTGLLVLLSLETGLEIECCKALTIDCLHNPSAGTVEVRYLKRRARGAEHKSLRVRDGGAGTPGGLIRRLIELTAKARAFCPSDNVWVYLCWGRFRSGIGHQSERIASWTTRHRIVDDHGQPLRLILTRLRKTHKALWYQKTGGHMARFAVGHTVDVAARHYADVPSLKPLHESTIADALEEAVQAAHRPILLSPDEEGGWREFPGRAGPIESSAVAPLLDGDQDVWLASCSGFYTSPFGKAGSPCPQPFWGCLECGNAVITTRKLPAILSFLDFIENERKGLSAADWRAKFGRVHARITGQVLPHFSTDIVAAARATLAIAPPARYLPPEVRS
jgi:hypothetical protein